MGKASGLIRILQKDEMELIHSSALRILEEVGMRIEHEEALDYLEAAGCRVDHDKQEVKFPATVVENAVSKLRRDFAVPTRPSRVPMRYTAMYFSTVPRRISHNFDVNTGGFTPNVLDLERHRHLATLQDVRDSIRLADALEHIDLVGLPCSAQDVPAKVRPIAMVAELVKLTDKIGGIEVWSKQDVEYITRIAEVVRGSKEELRRTPILVGYGEASVKHGFPQSIDTMPAGGTTAPATSAGTLTLGIAETLGGLVLGYAIDPRVLISVDVCPTLSDMRTMIYPYAGADRIPLVAAASQMLADRL